MSNKYYYNIYTHTHIYIYIYIYMEWLLRGGMRCGASGFTGGGLGLIVTVGWLSAAVD